MPSTRYLHPTAVGATLDRGKGVQQLLSVGQGTVSWLTISPSRDGRFVLSLHHVVDIGAGEFFDVSEFPPVDESEDHGEGREAGAFDDAGEALDVAGTLGATPDRWVNEGMIDAEYAAAR
jgi:hypothetical protein